MDKRTAKLVQLGVAREAAEGLVEAGIDTPRKIKASKVQPLRDAGAYDDATVKRFRSKK